MSRPRHALSFLTIPALCLSLAATPVLAGQGDGAAADTPEGTVVDLPLPAQRVGRYIGTYSVAGPGAKKPMTLHVAEHDGALLGRINGNDPTRLLYQGDDAFRPEDAPVFKLTFVVEDVRASRVEIQSPDGPMAGARVAEDTATSGPLYDTLARLDHAMFDAAFVSCDTDRRNALFTDDVEFYHDREGFEPAGKVRAPISSCPADHGMTRELVAGTVRVYPMAGYGALQTGMHRFTEPDGRVTVARFMHLWRKQDGDWKIARVLSFDHQTTPPPMPAE